MPTPTYYYPLTRELRSTPGSPDELFVPISLTLSPYGPNSSFLPDSTLQFAWDATSLDLLRSCPRKYQLRIIQGWHEKTFPPPLAFGIFIHTCLETWHKLLAQSFPQEEAVLSITHLALLLGELLPLGDTKRTKETLTRTVVWYMDQFANDHVTTLTQRDGTPMVEYSFAIPILQHDKIEFFYCGHIDRAVNFQAANYAQDYKTTAYELSPEFFEAFKPSGQMSGYNIGTQVVLSHIGGGAGVVIDGIQLGTNYTRFRRHTISYVQSETDEDIQDIQTWIAQAKAYSDADYWPKVPTSCGRYFKTRKGASPSNEREVIDSGCPFRSICSKPPNVREIYLKGKFVKANWDPLKSR